MAKTTCSGYNKTVAHAFPVGGPEAARLIAEQSGKLCPVELYHTQSDQKRLFLGSEIIAPVVHSPVASVNDLTGVYLRTSRGVWRGDSVFVSGNGCTYTVISGYGTGAIWQRNDTSAVQKYAGVITQPTISTGYLSINVSGDGLYGLYSVDQPSVLQQYNLAGGTFYLTDNVVNYLLATNTGDGAKLTVSTNRNDVEGNFRTVIPIVTLPVDNGEIHQMSWAEGGHAMPEKHGNFFINNFRFVRDGLAGGLMISEASGRAVTLTAGKVWCGGISSINLDAFDSRSGNNFWLYEDRGTGWVRYLTGQYNNTSYQSTSGFAPLQNTNRYAVNWIYRTVGDEVRCLSVLGTADYDLIEAEAAGTPARLPPIIPAHAILVGKIVAAKNATGAYKIYSAFDTAFGGGGGISDHQQLSNLQGGIAGEYYHSTSDQYSTWSKITESGGLPLWNGSGWLLTNSSSLAKITTSPSGCPLWDGGSWPVSISFVESGQYTIANGCGCNNANIFSSMVSSNPIALWNLNETTGNFIDSIGTGNLIPSGGGTLTYSASPLSDEILHPMFLGAKYSDTTSSFGQVSPWIGSYSIESVVMVLATSSATFYIFAYQGIGLETEAANAQVLVEITSSRTLNWIHEYGAGNNVTYTPPVTLNIGKPYHVVFTKNSVSKNISCYINGRFVGSGVYTNEPTGGTNCVGRIGSSSNSSSAGTVIIGPVALYDKVLSKAEIWEHAVAAKLN